MKQGSSAAMHRHIRVGAYAYPPYHAAAFGASEPVRREALVNDVLAVSRNGHRSPTALRRLRLLPRLRLRDERIDDRWVRDHKEAVAVIVAAGQLICECTRPSS
eukprot:3125413-Prymnesium_polylepis.2